MNPTDFAKHVGRYLKITEAKLQEIRNSDLKNIQESEILVLKIRILV